MKIILFIIYAIVVFHAAILGQDFQLEESVKFTPQPEKKILRFAKNSQKRKIVVFFSKLRVNTDGSPKSYRPDDLDGAKSAINSICNGMSVYKKLSNGKETKLFCSEAKGIFETFKNSNWQEVKGYRIKWDNAIAGRPSKDTAGKAITIPCVFQSGDYKGYFGSLTSVRNGIPSPHSGECDYKNQLDALTVPHLVLPGNQVVNGVVVYKSPLIKMGVGKEDIVFAFNEKNGEWSYAIIGDEGPYDNLGEGSVFLNMELMGLNRMPDNYTDAKANFDTGETKMFVAIIPNSKVFLKEIAKPYSKDNIEKRGKELLKQIGFADEQAFIRFLVAQKGKF